jgi:hypothetical protein
MERGYAAGEPHTTQSTRCEIPSEDLNSDLRADLPPGEPTRAILTLVTSTTCTHGLVQLQKFGTDTRDGLTYCRGCGLPTADSVLERQRGDSPVVAEPDTELDVLRELVRQASARNQILEGIRVGVFMILGLHVVVLLLAIFF